MTFALAPSVFSLAQQRRRNFTPASLFAASEPGVFYDPSDLTTLYQDSAGTTPVAADGDPVGLMLDKRLWGGKTLAGVLAGQTNKIGNSDNDAALMTSDFGAVAASNGTVTRSSDRAFSGTHSAKYLCNTATSTTHYLTVGAVPAGLSIQITGKIYLPTGSVARVGAIDLADGSLNQTLTTATDEWGNFELIRPAKKTSWTLAFGNNAAESKDGQAFYIDDLEIKEIPGNHATQATAAARPTYRTDGTSHWIEGDGVDDFLATAAFSLASASGEMSSVAAVRAASTAGVQSILDADGTTRVAQLLRINVGVPESIGFTSGGTPYTDTGSGVSSGTDYVLDQEISTSAAEVFVDGVTNGSTAGVPKGPASRALALFATRPEGPASQFYDGRIYAAVVRSGVFSSAEKAKLRTWTAEKQGRVL